MFKIETDFFIGLGIYMAIIVLSICIMFYTLIRLKTVKNPPILHTIILFISYTWLIISLIMAYYGVWFILTSISFIYLISLAPLFKLFFVSKYYHLKSKASCFRNLYAFSLVYLILMPIWITALIVL